jgi:hypothetical protein
MLFFARVTIGCKETRGSEGGGEEAEDAAERGVSTVLEEADDRFCTGEDGRNWDGEGEEYSVSDCEVGSAGGLRRIGREICCPIFEVFESGGNKWDEYGNSDSVNRTSREM